MSRMVIHDHQHGWGDQPGKWPGKWRCETLFGITEYSSSTRVRVLNLKRGSPTYDKICGFNYARILNTTMITLFPVSIVVFEVICWIKNEFKVVLHHSLWFSTMQDVNDLEINSLFRALQVFIAVFESVSGSG